MTTDVEELNHLLSSVLEQMPSEIGDGLAIFISTGQAYSLHAKGATVEKSGILQDGRCWQSFYLGSNLFLWIAGERGDGTRDKLWPVQPEDTEEIWHQWKEIDTSLKGGSLW